jgi:hypothetical protein
MQAGKHKEETDPQKVLFPQKESSEPLGFGADESFFKVCLSHHISALQSSSQ